MESSTSMDVSVGPCNGDIVRHSDNDVVNEEVEFLKEFDLYIDDIEDRLTVSRMVSDSVIKGMVCAIEQKAAKKIAQKDIELDRLKETLRLYEVGSDGNESMGYSVKYQEPKSRIYELLSTNSNGMVDHGNLPDSLADLKLAAKEQFEKLKKEIGKIKGSTSIRRKGSGSELLRLSGIPEEDKPDKWIDVDKVLDGLKATLESICTQSEEMVCMSKSLLFHWQREREFQAEIEGMVIKSCIQSLHEEFEKRLWDQNSQSYANESANWLEKMKDISNLRQELDAISKSLSVTETGQLLSHGSLEHRKASGDHVGSPPLLEENGKRDESTIIVPENLEHSQLKHLSKDDLFIYLRSEMTKMKRHLELKLQAETEKYYSLKREYLKQRDSSLIARKDKDLDSLRKKIPEVILKLDSMLTENQKLPSFSNNGESLDNLEDRLESLQLENHQLRDLLMNKEEEISHLHWQASDATEKILLISLAEENSSRMFKNLERTMENAQVEASICEDLYKFLLIEVLRQMKGLNEELKLEYDIMLVIYENMLREAIDSAAPVNMLEIEDSVIVQEICEIVFRESFKEAVEKVGTWNQKYIDKLRVNIAEREKLEQETILLRAMVNDKDKSVREAAEALAKEKEKYESASLKLENLRVQSSQQGMLISKHDEELKIAQSNLVKALEKVDVYEKQICQLNEQLKTEVQNLGEAVEEINRLHSVSEEHQKTLSFVEAREREHMKQMNSTIILAQGLSKVLTNFEWKATENIKLNSLRLENLSSEFSSLIQEANRLRTMELLYKQRLEKRCSDLQKAEAEVDLLGDEVDTLLSLLEKIYIGLDHYSPILQHYPGIMEVLKLVRRELSGEAVKSV